MTGVEIKGSHTGGHEKGRKGKSSNLDQSRKGEEEKDGFVKYLEGWVDSISLLSKSR